ncbi:MAG: HAMP domain-containing histidine kinase [Firmicutes bacterium]|nr:HAMP domain-containing histidine kinase [Bacillota bacterium]
MKIFADKTVKLQFIVVAGLLFGLVLAEWLVALGMADGYKQSMVRHDHALAGYMARSGMDGRRIGRIFTAEKTAADTKTGRELLRAAGYTAGVEDSLLPEVSHFYRRYAAVSLALSLAFSAILLAALYCFALRREQRLEKASEAVQGFLAGDTGIRLADTDEGSLSRFFADVNGMATSLSAHIAREKHDREFLRELISDISHQLRTPLAALQMYLEIMRDEKTGNDVVESFIRKSRRELDRMENLIQNLLKLARLDAGTIELEKNTQNLQEFLADCLGAFLTRAGVEGKSIVLQCDDGIMLALDRTWLLEAVGNIIKNALDHTEAGGRIEISGAETAVATVITVRDNGTGIHPEDIHHIFKRFYRSRFSPDRQGVGIGLALAKAIVEKHGGTITVQSELAKGSVFQLIFPKLSNL